MSRICFNYALAECRPSDLGERSSTKDAKVADRLYRSLSALRLYNFSFYTRARAREKEANRVGGNLSFRARKICVREHPSAAIFPRKGKEFPINLRVTQRPEYRRGCNTRRRWRASCMHPL